MIEMEIITIICTCVFCLIILVGLASLVCLIGTRTESVLYVMASMLVSFFVAHFVLDFMFVMIEYLLVWVG